MQPIERKVDWEGIRKCIATLATASPEFLTRSVLIGGAACWFYRRQLSRASDPDFREPAQLTSEDLWLSKDIDFTGIFRADAYDMLPEFVVTDLKGTSHLEIAGVRVGFVQVGVTFGPEEVLARAQVASFDSEGKQVQFLVIDPISLYREKQALVFRRNAPNDHAHFAVLKEFLALEFVRTASAYIQNSRSPQDQQQLLSFLLEVKHRAIEIAHDLRVQQRLNPILCADRLEAQWLRNAFQV